MRFEQLNEPYDAYSVTDNGHVMNIDTGKYIKEQIDTMNGRSFVVLQGSHHKTRKFFICNLVAEMFLVNEDNLGYIYFKDGNTTNNHANNLGYAINPDESKNRIERLYRNKMKEQRHNLIVGINNAIEKDNWTKARKLGIELWELEGANWHDRNK